MDKSKLIQFLDQFEMYISAGLNIDIAISLIESASHKKARFVVEKIRQDIESGIGFGKSLDKRTNIAVHLSEIIIHGESAGNLSQSIRSVVQIMEKDQAVRDKCLSAMYYPVIIGIIAILITVGLMKYVVPSMIPMLTGLNAELPLITKIVMKISHLMEAYGLYTFAVILLSAIGIKIMIRRTYRLRAFVEGGIDLSPFINEIVRQYFLTGAIRSLGIMINSGMRIEKAYEQVVIKLPYIPLQKIFTIQKNNIEGGSSLSSIFEHKKIPTYIGAMIKVGEKTGKLGDCLIRSSDIVDAYLHKRLAKLTTMVEPIMMIGIGTVVGTIALSIMLPIYDISKVLQHAK
jgi:type IV pilus assembly protein PilC